MQPALPNVDKTDRDYGTVGSHQFTWPAISADGPARALKLDDLLRFTALHCTSTMHPPPPFQIAASPTIDQLSATEALSLTTSCIMSCLDLTR